MKLLFVLGLLLTASLASASITDDAANWLLRQRFEKFMNDYGKSYDTAEEKEHRLDVFKANIENAVLKNIQHKTTVFGITKFSDLTADEFRGFLNLDPRSAVVDESIPVRQPTAESAPSSFDWRDEGAVTPVKNQGYCGSCWAFSATETIESAWFLAGNTLTEFSPEQIVQCDTTDSGCNGGWPTNAFKYVEEAGGMATETDYPYTSSGGTTGTCSKDFTISGGYVSGYEYATTPCTSITCDSQDEDTMISNLASVQPVSICVDASEWSSYTSGVFPSSSCSSSYYNLDHAVQLVGYTGYDEATGDSYYIVRNTWDSDWGVDGYIYLSMGVNACGIANVATMVDIASS